MLVYFGSVLYCKYYALVYINDFTKLKSSWLLLFGAQVPVVQQGGRTAGAWREPQHAPPATTLPLPPPDLPGHARSSVPACLTNVNKHFALYFAEVP